MKARRKASPTARQKDSFKCVVKDWAARLRVQPAQIRVQRMCNKWASCSPGKWVSFSENLVRESRAFQDYVIVHELLHLRISNHGKLFQSLMTAYLPDNSFSQCNP